MDTRLRCHHHHHHHSLLIVFFTVGRRLAASYQASSFSHSAGNPNSPCMRCRKGNAETSAAVKTLPHTNGPRSSSLLASFPCACKQASKSLRTAPRSLLSASLPPDSSARFPTRFKLSLMIARQREESSRSCGEFMSSFIRTSIVSSDPTMGEPSTTRTGTSPLGFSFMNQLGLPAKMRRYVHGRDSRNRPTGTSGDCCRVNMSGTSHRLNLQYRWKLLKRAIRSTV